MEHARGVCQGGILAKAPFSAVVPFSWNTILLLKCTPPLLFLRARRKRRAPCSVEKKKRAFAADLGVAVLLPLLCRSLECCARGAGTLVHCSPDRAPRWCGAWEVCGTERVFLLCVDCFNVQKCTAARLLRCASFSAVAAQCALWVRGRRIAFYRIEKSVLHPLQRTTPLHQPSAPRSGSGRRRTTFPFFRTCSIAK